MMPLPQKKTLYRAGLLFVILIFSLIFTVYSEITAASALSGLILCASSVVPSLFPFMVLSSIASKAASRLTGNGSVRTAVILSVTLGALCGFPVGAASVASMYKNGAISKEKAEYLAPFCNNTGPAFVVGVIGNTFWGSSEIGVMFYICQLLSAAIVFGIWRALFGKRFKSVMHTHSSSKKKHSRQTSANAVDSVCSGFCNSVADSAVSVVQICGYIVFFKVVSDTVKLITAKQGSGTLIYTFISSILEFTSGAGAAAELGGNIGIALCGFAIGFSGLSVTAQSTGLLQNAGLSAAPLFCFKIVIGLVSAALSFFSYSILNIPEPVFAEEQIIRYPPSPIISFVILSLAGAAFITARIRRATNTSSK